MVNEQLSRHVFSARTLRRPLILFVIAAALLALLAVAERDDSTSLGGQSIARSWSQGDFSSFFGAPAAPPASAARLSPAGGSFAPAGGGSFGAAPSGPTPSQAPVLAGISTPSQALGAAQATANQALNQTNVATGAAVAAQTFPPFVSGIVCPILFQARAQVVSTITALIASFPALAGQLNAVLQAALSTIDSQIDQFGCNPSL